MRLLIIGALEGQLSEATKLAMQGGARVAHAASIEIAMASLRAGRGADLLLVDVLVDIPGLIAALDAERIFIPVVACGTETNAAAAVNAIRAGAKEYIPLPPDAELIAAVIAAVARRIGKFEEASGGTLLLDEISEMDVRLQAKLLRALQERVIDRVGGTRPVPVDIRIIATSNRNLADAVRQGTFREDLLFRLNVVNLKLPPLRERPGDITALADHFVAKYAKANGLPARSLTQEARQALLRAPWPGNVRELENTLHRAVLLSSGDSIGPEAIVMPDGAGLSEVVRTASLATQAAQVADSISRSMVGRTVADVERDLILETLDHVLGNRTHAANILGISIRTLRNKLNQYADEGTHVPGPGEVRKTA